MRAKSLQSCLTCVTPWTGARQAPLSVGFSRQEHWSGLPSPPPGDLPGPGVGLTSLLSPALARRFFTSSATWEAAQRLRKQESDSGWLTTCYYICCVFYHICGGLHLGAHPNSNNSMKIGPGDRYVDFPGDRYVSPACQCRRHRDAGSIPGSGRSPGGGHSNPL